MKQKRTSLLVAGLGRTGLDRICTTAFFLSVSIFVLIIPQAGATSSDDLDIGSPRLAGSTSFSSGFYVISGGGMNIGGKADQFHFNKGTLTGNGTVIAYVESVGHSSAAAQSGVMLRNDSSPGSAFADVVVTPASGILFQSRPQAASLCVSAQVPSIKAPIWVRLARTGSSFVGSYSKNGISWTEIGKPRRVLLSPVVLAGVAVTSHNPAVLCASTFSHVSVTPDLDGRYLHTQGNTVRNRAGKRVTLCGTNIGGWLVTEGWMCGQSDTPGSNPRNLYYNVDPKNAGRFALEELEARFGTARAATLINTWRDNWFTDRDFDNIQSYGFNLIRVPFSWRNLQDANGSWYKDDQGNIDFSRFDWVVQEAAKRNIYVIFDLHVWPGQQQDYGSICQAGEPGDTQRSAAAQIWAGIAKHFKGNGTIAAFDLINEPTGSNDHYAAHRAFYTATRAQDPARMLAAEWVNTADFAGLGWTNTMCSGHYPAGSKAGFEKFLSKLADHTEYSTTLPCFVGECKSDDSTQVTQNAADMAQVMNHLGWAWTIWTYKTVNKGGWGLFDYNDSFSYNLEKDSYEAILGRWTHELSQWQDPARPRNYSLKADLIRGLKQSAIGFSASSIGTTGG